MAVIHGTQSIDRLFGTDFSDSIYAYGGDDFIIGGDETTGGDYIVAGDGNDYVNGGNGNDRIFGDEGDDTLIGGRGDDTIYGGVGNDLIDERNSVGSDYLSGDHGNDTIYSGIGAGSIVSGGRGADKIYLGGQYDKCDGGPDNDIIRAQNSDQVIEGGLGADKFYTEEYGAIEITDKSGVGDSVFLSIQSCQILFCYVLVMT
ncbi:calcium-binding protein [Pannonibacter sp. SL95]|uniref:calcium-binding protein n=1 Tax=Pannonibacter sp. SL95 TaxID=2995153 RepID=UPI002276302F|nr:hypothetical protein [Pannonibacter sp. SL95]MCY1706262.1 hypothetical protein [Pannonibacter sp. SL95]